MAIEAALIFPMLTWCYLAGFVWFDAFRMQSVNDKTAYALGDIVSRETDMIAPDFIDSLVRLHRGMTFAKTPTRLRVSTVRWDEDTSSYAVVWTQPRGDGLLPLSDDDVAPGTDLAGKIPIMSTGADQRLILVETWLPYEPSFSIGLDAFVFEGFTAISPRYSPQICLDANNSGDPLQAVC